VQRAIAILLSFTAPTAAAQAPKEDALARHRDSAKAEVKAALGHHRDFAGFRHGEIVPTQQAAIAIHTVAAGSVFGTEKVSNQRPYIATREGGYWVVFGTLPEGSLGGTATTVIRAADGAVLRLVHGQ
jgi:hypothetical protein